MNIRHTYAYILIANVILSFAGCSLLVDELREESQFDRTLESQSKGLAGAYSDIGSNGSIKPHTESSYQAREVRQGRTDGEIILGGPAPVPDLKTGETTIKGSPGGTTPRPGSVRDSTGSFGGTGGGGK